jgi:signal transduction histidine kinase
MISRALLRRLANSAIVLDWAPAVLVPPVLVTDAAVGSYGKPITVLSVAAAFVACLPLVARRHVSFQVLSVPLVLGIMLAIWQLCPAETVVLIPMIGLFELALRGDRRLSLWMGLAVLPCVVVSIIPFVSGFSREASVVVRNLVLCLLAIAGGDLVRTRRLATRRQLQITEQQALRRVGEERLQIAREIHDVVAHAMTAINVQAGVAAHLLERDPHQAYDALRVIKATSGSALSDLRATLDVLRDPSQGVPLGPSAGLADLTQLAAGLRSAGVEVEFALDDTRDVAAAVQSAAYRIVQEALTNVARHAAASRAQVRLQHGDGLISVTVTNDGVASGAARDGTARDGAAAAGNGLRGMRERAAALGGTLDAAPLEAGGWCVVARLPTGEIAPGFTNKNGSAGP